MKTFSNARSVHYLVESLVRAWTEPNHS